MPSILVQDTYHITGIGLVVVGVVQGPNIKVGMQTNIKGKGCTIKNIEMKHQSYQEAKSGDSIGVTLTNVSKGDINRGDLLNFNEFRPDADRNFDPASPSVSINPGNKIRWKLVLGIAMLIAGIVIAVLMRK